jgi:hypothetical protein
MVELDKQTVTEATEVPDENDVQRTQLELSSTESNKIVQESRKAATKSVEDSLGQLTITSNEGTNSSLIGSDGGSSENRAKTDPQEESTNKRDSEGKDSVKPNENLSPKSKLGGTTNDGLKQPPKVGSEGNGAPQERVPSPEEKSAPQERIPSPQEKTAPRERIPSPQEKVAPKEPLKAKDNGILDQTIPLELAPSKQQV